jgi:phenylacetate-CoA ligase
MDQTTIQEQPAGLKLREAKLREYIREVPLYQSTEGKINGRTDWAGLLTALPFITKQDIKTNFPRNFLRQGQSLEKLVENKQVEVEHTAGTTDNRADLLLGYGWWSRQEAWALSLNPHITQVLEKNPQARRVTISSPACNGEITYNGTPSAKRRSLGNTRFLSLSRFPFLLSEADLDRMIEETQEWDPVFLDTDPVYAAVFALHCERCRVKFPKLEFVFTSYEYTSVLHKRILERVFGVPVFNLYGSTETGHLLMENGNDQMVPSEKIAHLDVLNQDDRGIGELVVSTLTNDYMPLLNYRIGDLVEVRSGTSERGDNRTFILHGRAPDTLKAPDGRRITTRDVDQCFVGCEGIVHYRLHEISPGKFLLSYIPEHDGPTKVAIGAVAKKLEELIQPKNRMELKEVKFLLPEGSGKFVFNYPFVAG